MTRTSIDVERLRQMLDQGEPGTVLDVRHAEEHAEWAIPGSITFDAYDALKAGDPDAMEGLEVPADGPVVTVCGAGKSSAVAAEQLRGLGYEAYTLEGGMKSWSMAWNTAELTVYGSEAGVIQVRRTGKGCLSYVVGTGGEAAVIDASLEPEVYVELAEERGWKITRALDTHVHADHLSRSQKLADLAGATLHMPVGSPVSYPFLAVDEGGVLEIGAARVEVLWTPGHTPEGTSYLLDGRALFTGDTLFLQSVGRPDLGASREEADKKARALYGSLRHLLDLDPWTLILPGHTSEPVPFDGEPVCALLAEVRENAPLLREEEEAFVEKIAGRVPPTPENHERIVELNKAGKLPEGDAIELEAGANRCAVV